MVVARPLMAPDFETRLLSDTIARRERSVERIKVAEEGIKSKKQIKGFIMNPTILATYNN